MRSCGAAPLSEVTGYTSGSVGVRKCRGHGGSSGSVVLVFEYFSYSGMY
jgi:hypothetical protein